MKRCIGAISLMAIVVTVLLMLSTGAMARERALTKFTRERYYREMTAVYAEVAPRIAAEMSAR